MNCIHPQDAEQREHRATENALNEVFEDCRSCKFLGIDGAWVGVNHVVVEVCCSVTGGQCAAYIEHCPLRDGYDEEVWK